MSDVCSACGGKRFVAEAIVLSGKPGTSSMVLDKETLYCKACGKVFVPEVVIPDKVLGKAATEVLNRWPAVTAVDTETEDDEE